MCGRSCVQLICILYYFVGVRRFSRDLLILYNIISSRCLAVFFFFLTTEWTANTSRCEQLLLLLSSLGMTSDHWHNIFLIMLQGHYYGRTSFKSPSYRGDTNDIIAITVVHINEKKNVLRICIRVEIRALWMSVANSSNPKDPHSHIHNKYFHTILI